MTATPKLLAGAAPLPTGGLDGDNDVVLPDGTLTFVMTDVEGSTRLWSRDPSSAAHVTRSIGELVARRIDDHGGLRPEEQGEGDSTVSVFTSVSRAVAAAIDIQRSVDALAVGHGDVAVRIGIHTGEAILRDDRNYMGPTVIRAARIRDLGRGGAVLLSSATAALVTDGLPDAGSLVDLGECALKGLPRPERVWQLVHPDLPHLTDPLQVVSGTMRARSVPRLSTSTIGRGAERAELSALLADHRLVTITGSGGVGKTRLATLVAEEWASGGDSAVGWVELARVTDPADVAPTLASDLGIPGAPGANTADVVVNWLAAHPMLVVVDNCEHLVDACAGLVDRVLDECPDVRFLTTSREPLGISGEITWRTPSLAAPVTDASSGDADELVALDAVRLFVDRARLAQPGFSLTAANAVAVARICRRLDGIPLAIELAAARTRSMSPQRLADSLDDRFRVLTGGSRTALARQRTLTASVSWSYELLNDAERALLRRLCAFAGTFTLDDAEQVCPDGELTTEHVLELLTSLVDRSLVQQRDDRYWLLETIRHFAQQEGEQRGDLAATRDRHLAWCTAWAEEIVSGSWAMPIDRSAEVQLRRRELLAALQWSIGTAEGPALSLVPPLAWAWEHRGLVDECTRWCTALVAAAGTDDARRVATAAALGDAAILASDPSILALQSEALGQVAAPYDRFRLLISLGQALSYLADPAGEALLEEACSLVSAQGRPHDEALSMLLWTFPLASVGRFRDARRRLAQFDEFDLDVAGSATWTLYVSCNRALCVLDRSLDTAYRLARGAAEISSELPSADLVSSLCAYYACSPSWANAVSLGKPGRTWGYFESMVEFADVVAPLIVAGQLDDAAEALERARSLPSLGFIVGWMLVVDADVAMRQGDRSRVEARLDEAAAIPHLEHMPSNHVDVLQLRAGLAFADGEVRTAESLVVEALDVALVNDSAMKMADALEGLAVTFASLGRASVAARLLGSVLTYRLASGYRWRHAWMEPLVPDLLGSLDAAEIDEGRSMDVTDAAGYALRSRSPHARAVSGWDALTPTENEVVSLVATGLTNQQVADRLFVGVATVKTHLVHAYAKLGLRTRSELVAAAVLRQRDAAPTQATTTPSRS